MFRAALCLAIAIAANATPPSGKVSEISLTQAEKDKVYAMEMIQRELPNAGKPGKTYEVVALVRGTASQALDVLRDYERYPEYMPNVAKIEIVSREGDATIVGYTLKLPLGKVKKYRLRLWAETREGRFKVLWKKVPWPGLADEETIVDSQGSWTVEPSEKAGYLLVRHHVYTDPGRVPTGLGWIVDIMTSKSLPGVVTSFQQRIKDLYYKDQP